MRNTHSWLLGIGLLVAGCPGGGTSITMCAYDGRSFPVESRFPSRDGCNSCECMPNGSVACTEKACLPRDGGTGGDGGGADGGSGQDGGSMDVVMCATAPIAFPTFDKSCTDSSQCTFGLHQINCCGSQLALGFNVAEKARFDADEKLCRSEYPPCGCPAAPTKTEDGQTWDGVKTIISVCTASGCQTTLK